MVKEWSLATLLVISCQSGLLGTKSLARLRHQDPVRTFRKERHLIKLSSEAGGPT